MKKHHILILLISLVFLTNGCLKRDSMENIEIYTTVYPIEYITDRLYGSHSTVKSVYPDGIIIDNYELTEKQIKDYSKSGLFIFNGLGKEKDFILPIRNENNKLKIIDTTTSMEIENSYEELWLDPSNFLMMAQNIKTGLNEYINNQYLKKEINEKYEDLRIEISNIDAKLHFLAENSQNKIIVVSNDMFKYLEKYNITVYSLEENENLTDKTKSEVKKLISEGKISYIFMKQNEEENGTIKEMQTYGKVKLTTFNLLTNITDNERKAKKDYIAIMNDNIELLKAELYE